MRKAIAGILVIGCIICLHAAWAEIITLHDKCQTTIDTSRIVYVLRYASHLEIGLSDGGSIFKLCLDYHSDLPAREDKAWIEKLIGKGAGK